MTAKPSMQTPLKTVRHLGSAKEGANHFVMQRLTGALNAILAVFLVWLISKLAGADYLAARAMLHNPLVALALLLLIISGVIHMRLGMQVIIEDYITSDGAKLGCLALNTVFAILMGFAGVFAILKLSVGA